MKERAIYLNLNKLRQTEKIFRGLFWTPLSGFNKIKECCTKLNEIKVAVPQFWERTFSMMPPTYFNLNLFTAPFQQITDTYGIPNYKEVNPSFFGIITFPLEFGVMFGDLGHGFLILLSAIMICLYPQHV